MIAIIDYDAGNIASVEKAVKKLGYECIVTRDKEVLQKADKLILPGVGAFKDAMDKLNEYGLTDIVKKLVLEDKKPILGICLGLQLMFESSEENPGVEGLSLLKGKIVRLPEGDDRKIPHMGWNSLEFPKKSKLFEGVVKGSFVYFVHSYYLQAEDENVVAAISKYGADIHAAVEWENIYATQFHPEKSSSVGLKILSNFLEA
ncbi:MAG: imidazole glycerol phosphate synthase subunit HisH [Lachnospiraceae bacterium]|nr:imidazole glycerol phosphate synthase subunit HisH [Lachnospiraceae bacterium]MBP5565640.1 imidazole glycerol phosphate synthase subunit HisH [Lachnospiraceae bacterium]